MLLNPQEAMERHLRSTRSSRSEEWQALRRARPRHDQCHHDRSGIDRAWLGYTDFAEIDKQASFVKQYAAAGGDREPPKRPHFAAMTTLTRSH